MSCLAARKTQEVQGSGGELNVLRLPCIYCCEKITGCFRFIRDYLDLSIFVDEPFFVVLGLFFLISGLINTAWVVFLIPHGVAKCFPLSRAVFLASFGGIGNILGRIIQGPVVDKDWLSSVNLTIILSVINSVAFLVDPLVKQFWILGIIAFIGGFTLGARMALEVVMLKQYIPKSRFPSAYALAGLFYGAGGPIGGLLSGKKKSFFSLQVEPR